MASWGGKWALITGASAGIGLEFARQLAAQGANLLLTARRTDRLSQLAGELRAQHQIQTEVFPADLARPQAPEEIFRFAEAQRLTIEILVNNAGFGVWGELWKTDRQKLLEELQVNVTAVVDLTRLFVPGMVERGSGYVLIVASTAAFQPVPYMSGYAATKGFDMLFAGGIAEELRPHGVRVTCLCPGSTVTEFQEVAGLAGSKSEKRQESAEKVARVGLAGLARGETLVISGVRNWLGMEAQRLAPRSLVARVAGWMYRPPA